VAGLSGSMLRRSLPLLLALLLHVIQADDSVSLYLKLFLPVKEILIMENNVKIVFENRNKKLAQEDTATKVALKKQWHRM
jgi:hypothetical protein